MTDQAGMQTRAIMLAELGNEKKQASQVAGEFARMTLTLRRWYLCHPSRYSSGVDAMNEKEYMDWVNAADDLLALAKECAELPAKEFEEFQKLVTDVTKDVEAAK